MLAKAVQNGPSVSAVCCGDAAESTQMMPDLESCALKQRKHLNLCINFFLLYQVFANILKEI